MYLTLDSSWGLRLYRSGRDESGVEALAGRDVPTKVSTPRINPVELCLQEEGGAGTDVIRQIAERFVPHEQSHKTIHLEPLL